MSAIVFSCWEPCLQCSMHAYIVLLCWHCTYSLCINGFSLYAAMLTRSQLLKSKLPRPDMSTSPSGLIQAEDVRNSHPNSVQEFNVIPDVMNYISRLGVTPKRFKPVDYGRQHVRFCFAIWICICLSPLHSCCWHMLFQLCLLAHCPLALLYRRLVSRSIIFVVHWGTCCALSPNACWKILFDCNQSTTFVIPCSCLRGRLPWSDCGSL